MSETIGLEAVLTSRQRAQIIASVTGLGETIVVRLGKLIDFTAVAEADSQLAREAWSRYQDALSDLKLRATVAEPRDTPVAVSDAMREAGRLCALDLHGENTDANARGLFLEPLTGTYRLEPSDFDSIYRSMRKLEPGVTAQPEASPPGIVEPSGQAHVVAVGRVPDRLDGLLSLHVGDRHVLLSSDEARDLACDLEMKVRA